MNTNLPREILSQRFSLPNDEKMQDWDVEVASPNRTGEFLDSYYEFDDPYVRGLLIDLIIASYDFYIGVNGHDVVMDRKIMSILQSDWGIHADTVSYWALLDSVESQDDFAITPFMKRIWKLKNSV